MSRAKVATGHNPSPYLRRCRIPQLNTIRVHDDPCTPEDEESKIELIREKMKELSEQAKTQKHAEPSTSSTKAERKIEPASSLRGTEHNQYAYRNVNYPKYASQPVYYAQNLKTPPQHPQNDPLSCSSRPRIIDGRTMDLFSFERF